MRTWTDDEWDHQGPRYRLKGVTAAPRTVQQPHPPVILGASARPRSLALAARYAQEYNVVFLTPDKVAGVREKLNDACEKARRDPATLRLSFMTPVALGENDADARARAERVLRGLRQPRQSGVPGHWLVGTVERAAESLSAYAKAGIDTVYLQNHDWGNEDAVALLGVLAKEIA